MINQDLPYLGQATGMLNADDLDLNNITGKVLLLQFWTFGCYNCVNTLPYMEVWYDELSDKEIEFISIHTPEFGYEKKEENVKAAIQKYHIKYPVLLDNNYSIWKAFSNRWWPHFFLIDKQGRIRYNFVGEGNYDTIRRLLLELNDE